MREFSDSTERRFGLNGGMRAGAALACAVGALLGGAAAALAQQSAAGDGAAAAGGRGATFVPVTDAMLKDPDPADWLMYSRTYDAQRFSPLEQIHRGNVAQLEQAWRKPLPAGPVEVIPIVYDGVMYLTTPGGRDGGSAVWALDAATGDTLWEYRPDDTASTRAKALAIYDDMIYYTAPAPAGEPNPVIALDARTGEVRWRTPVTRETHTAGAIVANGKVMSGRTCNSARENCYIAAHDARTGEEAWRFYTAPAEGEPGDESWGGAPSSGRRVATWGLPGTYDAERGLVFWGISNPMPNTRADRHGGDHAAIPYTAPADLYSNSTVALRADTGELVWYYQHLPGDDWDMDINQEKMLIRTVIDPDPEHVKWINPDIPKGEARDVTITVGEGGGIWVNDRDTGQFIWATPFPYDTPNFILSNIDVHTGATEINRDLVLDEPGANSLVCFWNTRSFWPTAYHPGLNSLYVPYVDHCLDMTRAVPGGDGERRTSGLRPGADPDKFAGLARIDLTTGEIHRIYEGRAGGNGAVLATAGDVVFWGDIGQVLRAFDAETGEILWQSEPLGATVQTSTITYAVDGRQYVAVVNGEALLGARRLADVAGIELPEHRGNAVTVFALPDGADVAAEAGGGSGERDGGPAETTASVLYQQSMNVFRRFAVDAEDMYAFYRDVLGFEQLQSFGAVARFQAGASELKLTPRVRGRSYAPGGVDNATGLRLVTFFFPSEAALVERFASHGYPVPQFRTEPGSGRRVALTDDPDGQPVELVVAPGAPQDTFDRIEVGLTVSDLAASRAFYRDFVGLEELPPAEDVLLGATKYPYRHGSTTVNLYSFGDGLPADTGSGGIQYVVSDVDRVAVLADERTVQVDQPLTAARDAALRTIWLGDPDGITNYFAETTWSRAQTAAD